MAACAALLAASASISNAQATDTTRARMLRDLDSLIAQTAAIAVTPTTAQMTTQALRGQPGSSAGSTGAWGAAWGDVFAGVGFQSRARYTSEPDGSGSVGFGLGDSRREVGLEVAISSASSFRQGVGNNGSVSLKVHRVLPRDYGIAVGFENVANWGGPDGGSSVYGVVSHTVNLRPKPDLPFGSIAWNVGVGNSRYLTEQELADGKKGVNAFGSVGLRVHERASLIADWTGQDLVGAISFVPLRRSPLVMSVGVADLTGYAGDGKRIIASAGFGMHIFK